MSSLDLGLCKKNLAGVLGDGMKIYLHLLMSWFKRKISREDFDHEARKLMGESTVHLHNQFLLAILAKCQSLVTSIGRSEPVPSSMESKSSPSKSSKKGSSSSRMKRKSHPSRTGFQQRFCPVNPLHQALPVNLPAPEPEDKALTFALREMTLPDIGMVHGRMIVTAWDFGLDNMEDNAVRIMMHAIEASLKNILTVVLARRNAYRLREGKFRYAIGTQQPQTSLRSTVNLYDDMAHSEATAVSNKGSQIPCIKPSYETGMRDASFQLACTGAMPPPKPPVSLWDLLDALQTHKSAIPSHTVYATNMERILTKLWHPSHEELEQDSLHQQEQHIKNQISAHQLLVRS